MEFESIFSNKLPPKYISHKKINSLIHDGAYQFVEVSSTGVKKMIEYKKSIVLTPEDIKLHHTEKLNKTKKIILLGNRFSKAQYYRFLKFNGYDVYLIN